MQQSIAEARGEGISRYWKPAALITIVLFLANIYQPAVDLYKVLFDPSWAEVESVALAKQQQRLQQKNLTCFVSMERRTVDIGSGTMRYGACPNSDVLVEVYPNAKPAFMQWLTPENLQGGSKQTNAYGLLSSAHAATLVPPLGDALSDGVQRTQGMLKTKCAGWSQAHPNVKMVRVTDEGGRCYREVINVLSGRVEVRDQVPCDTKCQ